MSVIRDLLRSIPGPQDISGWSDISESNDIYGQTRDWAINWLIDSVITNKFYVMQGVYKSVMYFTSGLAAKAANGANSSWIQGGEPQQEKSAEVAKIVSGVMALPMIDEVSFTSWANTQAAQRFNTNYEGLLMMPNIEGVPISTSAVDTSREIEISEQQLIVQNEGQKQYWTDNAVPRLRTWTIEGYITSTLKIDQQFLIKPSLDMQVEFLDVCAKSRKPVLFKDDRGEFHWIQINNFNTHMDATYSNAVKVQLVLKEFNPYRVSTKTTIMVRAAEANENITLEEK